MISFSKSQVTNLVSLGTGYDCVAEAINNNQPMFPAQPKPTMQQAIKDLAELFKLSIPTRAAPTLTESTEQIHMRSMTIKTSQTRVQLTTLNPETNPAAPVIYSQTRVTRLQPHENTPNTHTYNLRSGRSAATMVSGN